MFVFMQSIDTFGQTIESVLIKYGKSIVNEQFVLNRLANATFDIYTSAVVLSRASTSLNEGLPSAQHEKLLAEAWTYEVYLNRNVVFFRVITKLFRRQLIELDYT